MRIAGGVSLVDIVPLLPQHEQKRYPPMKGSPRILVVHHSGADNRKDNIEAFRAMAHYHVRHKGWAGIAYHWGIPYRPAAGTEHIIYQTGKPHTVRNHTRGLNRRAEAIVLQGHLGHNEPSDYQIECLEAFLPWWLGQAHGRKLSWHSDAWRHGGIPKPACPGKRAVAWLSTYRKGIGSGYIPMVS